MSRHARGHRLIFGLAALLMLFSSTFSGGAAWAESPDAGTPAAEETTVSTETPTEIATETPTEVPTEVPTDVPTEEPTDVPTETATAEPSETATAPAETPTAKATETATGETTPEGTPEQSARGDNSFSIAAESFTIVEPVVQPGTTVHPGDTITVKTGLTVTSPQAGVVPPSTQLTAYPGTIGLVSSPTVPVADQAVCELASTFVAFLDADGTGTCRGIWTFTVNPATPAGDYELNYGYTVNGVTQTRTVTITVTPSTMPSVTFIDPVAAPSDAVHAGESFTITAGLTITAPQTGAQTPRTQIGVTPDGFTLSPTVTVPAADQAVCAVSGGVAAFKTQSATGTCRGVSTFQVDAGTAPGEYDVLVWYTVNDQLITRTITITVLPPSPVTIVEPVTATGTTLHPGDSFTVTTGLTIAEPQGGSQLPGTVLFSYGGPLVLQPNQPVIVSDDSAVCQRAGIYATFKTIGGTGTCRGVWNFQVNSNAGPGDYQLVFQYTVNGISQNRTVMITVEEAEAEPVTIIDPVVSPGTSFHAGESFTITTGLNVTAPQSGAAPYTILGAHSASLGLLPDQPTVLSADSAVCQKNFNHVELTPSTGTGTCRGVWSWKIVNGPIPGDYDIDFNYVVNGVTQTRTVTITVLPPVVTVIEPVISPSGPIAPGQSFTLTVGITATTPAVAYPRVGLPSLETRGVTAVSMTPTASSPDGATCSTGYTFGNLTSDTGTCLFTWTFTFAETTAPGPHTIVVDYSYGSSLNETRNVIVTLAAPPAVELIEPVLSPSSARPGETFTLTAGITANSAPIGDPQITLSRRPSIVTATSLTPTATPSGGATCSTASGSGTITSDTGTCLFTWTFTVNAGAAPGPSAFTISYLATGTLNEQRDVTLTVLPPPFTIVEPAVSPAGNLQAGQAFTLTAGFTLNRTASDVEHGLASVAPNAVASGLQLASTTPSVAAGSDANCLETVSGGKSDSTTGTCRFTWDFTVRSTTPSGNYDVELTYSWYASGQIQNVKRTVTITVAPPAIVIIDPVVSPGTTLHAGDTFTLSAGININSAQSGDPRVAIATRPPGVTAVNLTPTAAASDGATCSPGSGFGTITSDTGTCVFTWTFTVNTTTAPGLQTFGISYKATGTLDEQRNAVITVAPPAIELIDPVVTPSSRQPGETFTLTAGITLNSAPEGDPTVVLNVTPDFATGSTTPTVAASDGATCVPSIGFGTITSDTGTCVFTWTFTVKPNATAGPHDLSILYRVGGSNDIVRTATLTVTVPPVVIIDPVASPSASVHPGDTFTVTTGMTLNQAQTSIGVITANEPANLNLPQPRPAAESSGGAGCTPEFYTGIVAQSTTGTCRFTWTYTVPANLAPGSTATLIFSYQAPGVLETRQLTITVVAPPPAFSDPEIVGTQPLVPGQTFQVRTSVTLYAEWKAAMGIKSPGTTSEAWLSAEEPAIESTTGQVDCITFTHFASTGVSSGMGSCTALFTFTVPVDAAPGEYTLDFDYEWVRVVPPISDAVKTYPGLTVTVVAPPPVFSDPVVIGDQPFVPGQAFTIQTTVSLNPGWSTAIVAGSTPLTSWLAAGGGSVATVSTSTGDVLCAPANLVAHADDAAGPASCTFAWTAKVPAGTAPGEYTLTFDTQSQLTTPPATLQNGTTSVTVTVATPPPSFDTPVVVETQPVLPGQTVHVQTTLHLNPGWNASIAPDGSAATRNWFLPQIPETSGITGSVACVGYADEARATIGDTAGECTATWVVVVPDGTAPGDYTLSFDNQYRIVSPTTGELQSTSTSVTITVALPPPVFHEPVVSPNPVEQDGTFTVSVTVDLPGAINGNGYGGSVLLISSSVFTATSVTPVVLTAGDATCTTSTRSMVLSPSGGSCTATWTFHVPDETTPGDYAISLRFQAFPVGMPGLTINRTVDAPVTVKERPGRLVVALSEPEPAVVHPGEQFTVTYTIGIDRTFTPVSFPLVLEPRPTRAPSVSGTGGFSCQAGTFPLTFSYTGPGAASCTFTLVYTVPFDYTGASFPLSITPGTPTGTLPSGVTMASLSVPVIQPEPTATTTATQTATATATQTATQTATATATQTATATATATQTATATATQTATATATATQTATATATQTPTETATATTTPTQTATATQTTTATPTQTATATTTPTQTQTATASPTQTATQTATVTPTQTATATQTATITPTATATPAPRIRVSPTEVVRGQTVTVSVSGFGATEVVRLRWLVGSTWTLVGNLTTNASGGGSTTVLVPTSAAVGANKVRADSSTHAAQTGAVTVSIPVLPTVELSALRVSVGQAVSVTAEHFPANTSVAITWRRPGGSTANLGSIMTDQQGTASGSFTVPATEGGADSRVTVAAGGVSVTVTVEVSPRIIVSPGTVSRGQAVTVTLSGYAKGEVVRIRWLVNGTWITVGTVTTSNTGGASVSVTVPATATAGQNSVRGDGTVFRQQTNAVMVT